MMFSTQAGVSVESGASAEPWKTLWNQTSAVFPWNSPRPKCRGALLSADARESLLCGCLPILNRFKKPLEANRTNWKDRLTTGHDVLRNKIWDRSVVFWVGKRNHTQINNASSKWCKTTPRVLKSSLINNTHRVTKQADRLTAVLIKLNSYLGHFFDYYFHGEIAARKMRWDETR